MSTNSPPSDVFNRLLTTAVVVAIHAFLWSAWLLGVWVWMPRTEQIFREFNMRLPDLTVQVIYLSRWLCTYPVVAGMGLCLFLGVDGLIYFSLRSTRRFVSELWSIFVIVMAAAVIVVTLLALLNPLTALHEGLSK